jgi:hypothetical protein
MAFQPDAHYTQQHLEVLQAFANQVAVVIRNVEQLGAFEVGLGMKINPKDATPGT